ncbi:MFS general substrate transporter [Xylariaceae sp. FL1019]|nr:MFS general substrate transporter [Xylariaceae sp. FL1019]
MSDQAHTTPSTLFEKPEIPADNALGSSGGLEHDTEKGPSSPSSVSDKAEQQRDITGVKWFFCVLSLYATVVIYGLDTTIAAAVQGDIVASVGHVEQLAWIGAGFPLGSVSTIFLFGYLFNAFNMKWTYVFTVLLFNIGSALCGAAPNMTTLIVGRVIAGAGGTGIYLGSLNYITAMTVPKERGLYTTLIGFSWGVGGILGPIVGGAFAISSATWRWGFYLNLVVGAASAPAYIVCLPNIRMMPGVTKKQRLLNIDFVGFLLGSGMWTSFLLALTMAGGQWPWKDGRTIATFVAFGATITLYGLQQYFCWFTTPAHRAFPVQLLKERTQILLYICNSAFITTFFIMIFYIPLFFEFVKSDSSLTAALRLLPFVAICITTAIVTGHYVGAVPFYNLLYIGSGILMIIGGSLMVVYLVPDAATSTLYGFTVIIAFGAGLSMLKVYSIAALTTAPANVGGALSMHNVSEVGGEVISLAISGQIYHSIAVRGLLSALDGQGFTQFDIISALAGARSSFFAELDAPLRTAAESAISKALQSAFILVPVSGGVMLVAALLMRWEKLTM